MRALIVLCVRRYGAVSVISAVALVMACWGARHAPLDVFPDFVPAQVDIQTEAPGFAPEQVEQLVTRRIESAVNGAAGLAALRSQSIPGLSVVTVNFADGVDLHIARQGLSERLSEIGGSLPAGIGVPKLSPLVSSTMDLLKIGLVSDKVDAFALRDAADWLIKPRLLAVPGVAHVIVFGGAVRQVQITPKPNMLVTYDLTLADLADGARAALALRGAGYIDLPTQRVLLTVPIPTPDVSVLGETVIALRHGFPVHLRDVAEVAEAAALRSGDALVMGKPGVLLALASQYGANTLTTTLAVERALADLQPALDAQGIKVYPGLHRPANFIERALGALERSLTIAALLILVVLYLFVRDLRAALIAFAAIPLSLLAAVLVLDRLGYTLNTMTLGGFAVALGVLVDDAIIGIENILRRLRGNGVAIDPRPRLTLISEAAWEVRAPVVYATLVVMAVFLPELFTSSVQGRFVAPLALAFILAVAASLVVAMTVTPALCALLLKPNMRTESPSLSRLKAWQAAAIGRIDAHFKTALVLLGVGCVTAFALLPFLGGTFMPEFREGHFVMQVSSSIPGTSIDEMRSVGRAISAEVMQLPYVATIAQQIGRAELSEDTSGPHRSEFHVELKGDAGIDQGAAQEDLRRIIEKYPGLQSQVVTFLGDRIGESLTGETAQVAVKVFGADLDVLDRVGDRIVATLEKLPGVVDLQFKRQSGTPALAIELQPRAMAAMGLKAQDVLDTVQTAYAGALVGQVFDGIRTIDTVLMLPDRLRNRPEKVGDLRIATRFGPIPLAQVAHVTLATSRYSVEHERGLRRITVTFNVDGVTGVRAVVNDARQRIASAVKLPAGCFVEFTGAGAAEEQTRTELAIYSGLALALILMILILAFKRPRNVWLVMLSLPLSLIGSIATIAITGIGLSLGSVIGLVTVFGVSARNAILQLAHYEHLVDEEAADWSLATVRRGANERLIPILMTASVTALGLAPLAYGINAPGQEIEGPMAVTVLGGLAVSTILNLLLLPVFAYRLFGREAGRSQRTLAWWKD